MVVSGPGGVGKGTVVDQLLARDPRLWLSRSWTTRPRRPGEDPDAYHFVDRATFDRHIDEGGFVEWVDFLDYRQGTPVPQLPDGHDVVFEIDVHGGLAIARLCPDPLLIFLDAPDRDAQRERLERRGDPAAVVEARIQRGDQERSIAGDAGYRMVVNDDLDATVARLESTIAEARRRRA